MRRLLVALALLAPQAAFAGGFELDLQGPQGMGTAGAQTARAEGASAIYYNPAGLAFTNGFQAVAGANLYQISVTGTVPGSLASTLGGPASGKSNTIQPAPTIFVSQRLDSHFALGVGVFANFGDKISFPSNFSGRFRGTLLNLESVTINPTLAIRPHPRIAFGVGIDIVPTWVHLSQALNFGVGEGNVDIGAAGTGVGANVGALFILVPQYLNLGISYRSSVHVDLSGHATLNTPAELAAAGGPQTASSSVNLPNAIVAGLSSRPVSRLSLSVDMRWTLWSDFKNFPIALTQVGAPAGTTPTTQDLVLNWRDAAAVRGGAEYRFLKDQKLPVRLGFGYDWTPVPRSTLGPLTPDNDRIMITAGAGYSWNNVGFDVSYAAVIITGRTSTDADFPARFSGFSNVISAAITVHFDNWLKKNIAPAYKMSIGPNSDCDSCGDCCKKPHSPTASAN